MGNPLAGARNCSDGSRKKVLRHEALGDVTKKQASKALAEKLRAAAGCRTPARSRLTFAALTSEWLASVVPMYKHSTQKHRRFTVNKHLLPRFGDWQLSNITRQEIQAYVAHLTQTGYAPKTVDHIHDVLSAILRTAMKWGHIKENPARGVVYDSTFSAPKTAAGCERFRCRSSYGC